MRDNLGYNSRPNFTQILNVKTPTSFEPSEAVRSLSAKHTFYRYVPVPWQAGEIIAQTIVLSVS